MIIGFSLKIICRTQVVTVLMDKGEIGNYRNRSLGKHNYRGL